jgi:hypothetical protein
MASTKKRLTFVEVRKLANQKGLSMDRHHKQGFRIWDNTFHAEKYNSKNLYPNLHAAKEFIESYEPSTSS